MRLLKQDFQNLQSAIHLGEEEPHDKAIGLTWPAWQGEPARASVNLGQRNPARTAPKDAFFNTDDADTLARRIAMIDAHEAMGHAEDPALGHLLNLREHIRHTVPDEHPDKRRMLSQIVAGIEAPGITMEELTNEVLNPEVDSNLSQRVRENFAERAGEPGALFGGGTDTMDPDQAMRDMRGAEMNRAAMLGQMGVEQPPYSTFGKAVMPGTAGFPEDEPNDDIYRDLPDNIVAIQEQAYRLAELNTPWDKERWPTYEDWQDAIEMDGEVILDQMMHEPEYAHLRELYSQHSQPPENYGELQLPFKERDDIIDYYRNQGFWAPGENIHIPGIGELPPVPPKAAMHAVDGQPQWPTGTLYDDESGFTTGEPMDLAFRLLKYEPRDFLRQRRRGVRPRDMVPPNPFPQPKPEPATEAPAAEAPVEEPLAWGNPEGDPGHLEDRMEERFPDMQDEIKERITAAMNEHGGNIRRDPHLQTNEHAIVTHAFEDVQHGGDTHAIARIRGTRHPDFEGKLTPTVTTVHGVNSRGDLQGALRDKYASMIDATGTKMTWQHLGRKKKSYYVKVLDRLLKRIKSPEAKKNKQKYDKDYHSSPSRVKYRVDLKRERRKRGVYGKGGKDMSHTKDGGLVAEASSTNRARQGSNGNGTKKASPFDFAWALLKNVVPQGEDPSEYARAVQQAIAAANVDTTRGRSPTHPNEFPDEGIEGWPDPFLQGSHDKYRRLGITAPEYPEGHVFDDAGEQAERAAASLPDPSLTERPATPREQPATPPFSGDAPLGQLTDVYQSDAPNLQNLPPSPGPETSPFPPPPLHDRPVAVRPRTKLKSSEQIRAELRAQIAEQEAMAPDLTQFQPPEPPEPAPAPVRVKRRQTGPSRGTRRGRSFRRE